MNKKDDKTPIDLLGLSKTIACCLASRSSIINKLPLLSKASCIAYDDSHADTSFISSSVSTQVAYHEVTIN